LVGFEFSREESDRSATEQDDRLERNIYRYPDRQGPPEGRFNVLHDIYSLGVVMLEIGLWHVAKNFERDYVDMEPELIAKSLQEHAEDRLPHYMGTEYKAAVMACLQGTLIKPEHTRNLSLPSYNQQRAEVNLALFEKVIRRLDSGISLK
jgi:hypothetical protein